MIQVNGITKEFASRILFNDITFTVNKGERIGFVGRNGCGKSTLFKIITGDMEADAGDISIPKAYSIGVLKQYIEFSKPTVLAECMQVLSVEEQFDNYKAEKILFGLGFTDENLKQTPESFSGGYQIRINLAKILLKSPNLLLLDEPTNYLDIVSMRWLENFLRRYPGEIIIISHDREFMSQVCTHTIGLHRQKLIKVKGKITEYKAKLEEEESIYESTRLNQEGKRKEIEDFVNRFKAKASKAAQAQSRQKMLDKMDEMDALESISSLDFNFTYKDFQAKTMVKADNLSFGYDKEKPLFKKLDFYVNKGDKIAIIGKNGKGKSTLLNLIAKRLNPDTGNIELHPNIDIGHFGQTNINTLHNDYTIEEEIQSENPGLTQTKIRSICGTMMFSGEDAKKKISILSGGEKSRVLLGKILAKETNLLLLDEPTNHLDQESIDALVNKLNSFKGAVIIVTHSELILRRLAKKFVIFHHDKCEEFNGSYDEFLEKIGWEEEIVVEKKKEKLSSKDYKHLRSEMIKERSRATKSLKNNIEKNENEIIESEGLVEQANDLIIKASQVDDGEAIVKYSKQLSFNQNKIEELFLELEELSEKLNIIESEFEIKLNDLN
jgi:ATP-binding cassette subfamily F protein 3